MNVAVKYSLMTLIVFLLTVCVLRPRRYWRELHQNKPSRSLRVGYALAVFTSMIGLAATLYTNSPESWQLFTSLLLLVIFFCLKISFSPSILAATLTICLINLQLNDTVSFVDVWIGVSSVVTWRFPEEIRALYAALSFLWVVVTFLSPADAAAAEAAHSDQIEESVTGLGF